MAGNNTVLLSVAVVLEVDASPERRAIETHECSRVTVTVVLWEDADSNNMHVLGSRVVR